MPPFIVKVPATSANMGPGFDCLALALDVWNTLTIQDADGLELDVRGLGEGELPTGSENLVAKSFARVFDLLAVPVPGAKLICDNRIPLGRGLGSSSAAAVAGIVAGNELAGRPLTDTQMLSLAIELEGHPDNASAALLGGCQIIVGDGDELVTSSVRIPDGLTAVLFIPDVPMPTRTARSILPSKVPMSDAVFNAGRTALLVNSLARGDLAQLAVATQDKLHQPVRQEIFHPMRVIIQAALDAGALGAFLSGAGSSILALCEGREMTIGYEMAEAGSKSGVGGDVIVTHPTLSGAFVEATG